MAPHKSNKITKELFLNRTSEEEKLDAIILDAYEKYTNQNVAKSNNPYCFYLKKTDGYLKRVVFIQPDEFLSSGEALQVAIKIKRRLVSHYFLKPINILIQPKDQNNQSWIKENSLQDRKGVLKGYTIPPEKLCGTVAIRASTAVTFCLNAICIKQLLLELKMNTSAEQISPNGTEIGSAWQENNIILSSQETEKNKSINNPYVLQPVINHPQPMPVSHMRSQNKIASLEIDDNEADETKWADSLTKLKSQITGLENELETKNRDKMERKRKRAEKREENIKKYKQDFFALKQRKENLEKELAKLDEQESSDTENEVIYDAIVIYDSIR